MTQVQNPGTVGVLDTKKSKIKQLSTGSLLVLFLSTKSPVDQVPSDVCIVKVQLSAPVVAAMTLQIYKAKNTVELASNDRIKKKGIYIYINIFIYKYIYIYIWRNL